MCFCHQLCSEGVLHRASTRCAATGCAPALTILGVAVGVFVVVVISAAVHGINMSVAQEFESAGPTTFFVSALPDLLRGLRRQRATPASGCSNPPISMGRGRGAASASPNAAAVGMQTATGAPSVQVPRHAPAVSARSRRTRPNWPSSNAPDMLAGGRAFTRAGGASAGARVVVINTRHGRAPLRQSPTRSTRRSRSTARRSR